MFRVPLVVVAILLYGITFLHGEKRASLSQLETEVKAVLANPDNVSRRKQINPVFELARRYSEEGQTARALHFYTIALEHHPWNMAAQLETARLLQSAGETDAARQKAELVWGRAETDELMEGAARLLDRPFNRQIPAADWPEGTAALALVPIGSVDAWLIQALREEMQDMLGIPVIVQQLPLRLPTPKRDPLRATADELRERIAKANQDPAFRALLKKLKLSIKGLDDDERVFAVTEAVMDSEPNKEPVRRFREELAFMRRLGPQWDAADILSQIQKTWPVQAGSPRGYLGVTMNDIYGGENRFVFGLAANGGNHAVLSYRRYTSALYDEPPDRQRLKERVTKQALSSTGLLFGIKRCSDPLCTRAYVNGLAEHDAKQIRFCPDCSAGFKSRFAQPGTDRVRDD